MIAQLAYRGSAASGHAVGSTYAANTLGNILGSLTAGFVLIPALGTRGTILLAAALSGAVGLSYLVPALLARRRSVLIPAALAGACVAAAIAVAPPWHQTNLASAPFMLGGVLKDTSSDRAAAAAAIDRSVGELVEYRDGATGSVSVTWDVKGLQLRIDGVREAAVGNFATVHNFIGHLPLLLHGEAKNALIIGLGSGATLGSVLTHPVSRVDSIEISSDVVDLVRRHFAQYTGKPLGDPRVRQIIGDGRNFLRHTDGLYDVIISQPSHCWQSGAASLFTREFFTEIRDHLAPRGVAGAWFWSYNEEARRSVIRAWREVFDDAYVFERTLNTILVGRRQPGRLAVAHVAAAIAVPAVRRDLSRLAISEPADIFGDLLLGPQGMVRYAGDAPVNSDDNAFVEFHGLRGFETGRTVSRSVFEPYREDPLRLVDLDGVAAEQQSALARRLAALREAEHFTAQARALASGEGRSPLSTAMRDAGNVIAQQRFGNDPEAPARVSARDVAMARSNLAAAYAARKMPDDAIEQYEKAIEVAPQMAELCYNLGIVYHQMGRLDEARAQYTRAIGIDPHLTSARYNLGVAYLQQGQYELAVVHIDQAAAAGYEVPPQTFERLRPYRR